MKITVFVNWLENKILTHEEFEKEVESEALERFNDSDYFSNWLACDFDPSEIFNFTESEKETQRNQYKEDCRENAKAALLEEYETIELEI